MRFIIIPVWIMSLIFSNPEPKTTALGGVATGSMKAQDAAIVAEIINRNGCTSILIAIGANIGKSIAVVARLDVISVNKLTLRININTNTKTGNSFNNSN
jgi:hypothetical protein